MTHIFGVDYLNWRVVDNHHLERKFTFPNFTSALDFVNIAGNICEEQDHHAEFVLSWGSVVIRTWSHDVDGITERDHNLAKAIDGVAPDGS
tara:strand:- start:245 stop:517 length:273 start_codon:yes stop_codon:yes gene_type:complete